MNDKPKQRPACLPRNVRLLRGKRTLEAVRKGTVFRCKTHYGRGFIDPRVLLQMSDDDE